MDERKILEQEIRNITADLTSSVSPIGDWKHIKYTEYISQGLDAPYTEEEMREYYSARQTARDRINEIQQTLESM